MCTADQTSPAATASLITPGRVGRKTFPRKSIHTEISPLCHLDRSAAQWRDLCVDALSWKCRFFWGTYATLKPHPPGNGLRGAYKPGCKVMAVISGGQRKRKGRVTAPMPRFT